MTVRGEYFDTAPNKAASEARMAPRRPWRGLEDVMGEEDVLRSTVRTLCYHFGVIFVFGSNQAGIHGAGAAQEAQTHFDAQPGVGEGPTGGTYAIPTKDKDLIVRPLADIAQSVVMFLAYAKANPDLDFLVTRIGCGYAGYTDADIAPLFKGAPNNCLMPKGWRS